jgi:hypothetical protein
LSKRGKEKKTSKGPPMQLKKLHEGSVLILGVLLGILVTFSSSRAGVVEGKVTSIRGNLVELSLGSEKGVKLGDSGRIYYKITIGEKERQIFIAKFKISYLSEKSCMAQIEEKTGEIKVGFLAEVTVKSGELEVKSEPSGAKVYLDGKEVGESPIVLSDISPGRHLIRLVKEGFEPYEVLEVVAVDRKGLMVNLNKIVKEGELLIQTEPSGATIYLNNRSVGRSPYEGRGLSPGIYRIRVTKEGYENWEKSEIVEPGRRVEVLAQLKGNEGELELRSDPPGGKVYLDGKYVGVTPLHLLHIRPGKYSVLIVKEGYVPYEEQLEVTRGDRKTVRASMKSKMGELDVSLKTPGASLTIDGKSVEVGPRNYVEKELPSGKYKIRVAKEAYETWEGEVAVKAGEKLEMSIELNMKKGEVLVRTEPPGAIIYFGGKSVGTGSYEGKGLIPGSYKIRVMKEGYEAWEGDVVVEGGKKAEVLAKLNEIDWAQRSCDAPVWNLGDNWTFKDAAGKFWSNQILEIRDDSFIMRVEGSRELYAYDKKTLGCNYLIDRSGRKVKNTGAFRNIFDFPLVVGKRWRYSTESGGRNIVNELRVEGVEEVTTPAGTFKAYKIYYRQSEVSRATSGWVRHWYAPVVKWWVKREVENSPYWALAYGLQSAELIYYRMKQ